MQARLITARDLILSVAKRWYKAYQRTFRNVTDNKFAIYEGLRKLDLEACTREDVDAVIGNTSWTDISCDGCGERRLRIAVEVGEERDYESCTATLCASCVQEAVHVLATGKARET
jgi:hypothetical protein